MNNRSSSRWLDSGAMKNRSPYQMVERGAMKNELDLLPFPSICCEFKGFILSQIILTHLIDIFICRYVDEWCFEDIRQFLRKIEKKKQKSKPKTKKHKT